MTKERLIFGDGIEVDIPKERLFPGTKLYIAGPQGFMESTRTFHNRLVRTIQSMGGEALDPWDLGPKDQIEKVSSMPVSEVKVAAWKKLNYVMIGRNLSALRAATGVVANLDGPDVDSGTAAEIGYAYGRGIPVLGYRGDFRRLSDNLGGMVNIQVEEMIRQSGQGRGQIITKIIDLPSALSKIWGSQYSENNPKKTA